MGLQSALTTALTGLQAAETTIDVIGNNVANSNTVGYKASEVVFATQFLRTQSIGSAPGDGTGGTNPRQVGLGVKVAEISPNFTQGTIEISSNALDLAIQGDGFLIVQGSQGEELYTRNGQLSLNSLNQVVTATGNTLLGYSVDEDFELQTAQVVPIEIPLGAERVAQATSRAVLAGVLNPTVEAGTIPGTIQSQVIGDASVEAPDDATFNTEDSAEIVAAPAPGSASSADSGLSTGLLDNSTYTYRLTLRDANGVESSASTEWTVTTGASGGQDEITITGLVTDTSGDWTDYVLYRLDAGETDFYEVTTTSATAATIPDIVDSASLASISSNPTLDTTTIENGSYNYYVTYFNSADGTTETRPSALVGPIAVGDDDSSVRFDLSGINPPDDAQFNRLRIYRNASGTLEPLYLLDTIPAPGQGDFVSTYVDTTPSSEITGNATLDFNGPRAQPGTLLTDMITSNSSGSSPLFQEGTLEFTGQLGGSTLSPLSMDITSTSTVQDLTEFVNDALGLQQTSNVNDIPFPTAASVTITADGEIQVVSNLGEENETSIALTGFRLTPTGSSVSESVNLNFSEVPPSANGPGTTTEFIVYDSLGSPLTVRVTTVLESSNSNSTTYRWYAQSGDSNPAPPEQTTVVGNGVLVFDSNGALVSSPSNSIALERELTASESPLEIELDFSTVTSLAETNASGDPVSTLNVTSQNGFPPGVLTDFIITDSGLIQGQFSNGTQRTLGQVVMARFANAQGLEQLGDSLFAQSVNSGEPIRSEPGEDGLGTLTAGAVELSNTDIGQDLVEMILAQTQYQAGSRVIAATQELLDELLSLQR